MSTSIAAQLEQLGTFFALDTETALAPLCFQPGQWRLLQLHNDQASLWYDIPALSPEDFEVLKVFLERRDLEITGQFISFDYRVLLANGIRLHSRLFDTHIASSLLHNGKAKMSHALEFIAKRELGLVMDKSLQAQDWMKAQLSEADLQYALEDVRVTWEVAGVLHEQIAAQGLLPVYQLECALVPAVVEMEHVGFYVCPETISSTIEYYRSEAMVAKEVFLETLDGRLESDGLPRLPREEDGSFNTRLKETGSVRLGTKRLAGFNINSSQQLLQWFKYLNIEPLDDTGKPSTDKKVLARYMSDELVRLLMHYKRVEKRSGMAQKLQEHCGEDGRIHARFMPLATGTGRFASSGPNLQQVPRDPDFRCAFKPSSPDRRLVQADYSGMELRVAAAIAGEQAMIDAFNAGADIHTRTAALMYGISEEEVSKEARRTAKALNFGALYGSSAKGVQDYCVTLGLLISQREAADLLKKWHDAYPAFGRWHRQCQNAAMRGEPVRTRIGRRRLLYGDDNRLTTQANNVVQGTSADIMKMALVEIHRQLPPEAYLVATCHDEVIAECREQDGQALLELVLREMEEAAIPVLGKGIRILAEGGVLSSWGDK